MTTERRGNRGGCRIEIPASRPIPCCRSAELQSWWSTSARQQQVRPAIEHHAQLAPRGGVIIAAKRMVRMLEVADETVLDATRDRERPHHSVAFERPAHSRVRAKLSEVSGCDMGGRLEVIGGRAGYEVYRPADRVPSIQGALRSTKHFDAIQIEKPREHHRRPGEVHTVEIHRRTWIRSGKQNV